MWVCLGMPAFTQRTCSTEHTYILKGECALRSELIRTRCHWPRCPVHKVDLVIYPVGDHTKLVCPTYVRLDAPWWARK